MIGEKSSNLCTHRFRAKYARTPEGELRLYQVQGFSTPVFREEGYESQEERIEKATKGKSTEEECRRAAARRARRLAFDLVMCNPSLNAFFTLTYAPTADRDRTNYLEVYWPLRSFLSNRVQRKGLCYVMTCERHHASNGIHFHGLCNAEALNLVTAHSPYTGEVLTDHGKPIYNIADWAPIGFSTCKLIGDDMSDRQRVARYITKYITKAAAGGGEMVGGRYIYHGGALARPVTVLGDSLTDFTTAAPFRAYSAEIEGVGRYEEYSF